MKIKVRAFASFREILGKELDLESRDDTTAADLLAELASRNKRFKEAAFEESGQLRDYVLLMINRKRIDPQKDLLTRLHDGDELAVFPPVAGG
ncbi:Small archaeal modifier protein 3 [uncultured archaeon]|nr:Small archaeal modifier protein 3 [uncultured archaeon]